MKIPDMIQMPCELAQVDHGKGILADFGDFC